MLFPKNTKHASTKIFSHQPIKVGGSFGTANSNIFIGRIRHSFGNGMTGNLVIGDNFTYQELLKLSLYSKALSYNISLTHFDNAETQINFMISGMHQVKVIQRIDTSLFNKVRFSLNIGAHIYSDSVIDFRMLMPMMAIHNWNNNSESITLGVGDEINNIMGFESSVKCELA